MSSDLAAVKPEQRSGRAALFIAAGILCSRLAGLIRERVFAHFLGSSFAADAFRAALRIPNFLQNLFGEGVLSASFIPVYARLLSAGDEKEADRVAGVIGTMLAVLTSVFTVAGIISARWLIDLIAPGFHGESRELTILLVQILFPGIGALVLSAWCLGILNSHGRFFLSYTAPVLWNLSIIVGLVAFRSADSLSGLAVCAAWSSVIGSIAQLGVQLPTVWRVARRVRPGLELASEYVRTVIRSFVPVFISRGVVQLSAYIDNFLASFLPAGTVALLGYAQTIALLPVSLFGMAISAAELPAMSRELGEGSSDEAKRALNRRLNTALRRLMYLVIPASTAFFIFGDTIAGVIYQTGRFTRDDAIYVWALLAGSSVGLVASTSGRICSSTFYALQNTRTPLKYALIRVFLTTVLGAAFAFPLPHLLHIDGRWGGAGLTASAGLAGWVEFLLLRRTLQRQLGRFQPASGYVWRLWLGALFSGALLFPLKFTVLNRSPLFGGLLILGWFGAVYLFTTVTMKLPEAISWWTRLRDLVVRRLLRRGGR